MDLIIDSSLSFCGDAAEGTATKNSATAIEYKLTDNLILSGAKIIYRNACFGDYIEFDVIDKDNILGFGANTVLKHWVVKWYIDPYGSSLTTESNYGGTVLKDLYLRLNYTSVGQSIDVDIKINYFLHKLGA